VGRGNYTKYESKFVATAVLLGTLFLTSAATTFYYRSKWKKAENQLSGFNDNLSVRNTGQHVPQEYQAQIQVSPQQMNN